MFLRNYDNVITSLHFVNFTHLVGKSNAATEIGNSTTEFGDGYYNQKQMDGSILNVMLNYGYSYIFPFPFSLSERTLIFGNGTDPVTYDDYKLSNLIDITTTSVSRNTTYNSESKKWQIVMVATINNLSDTDITISEWGVVRYNRNSPVSNFPPTQYPNWFSLVFREVLDNPIVIEAGTTATLTFSVDIPMANHP